MPKFFVNKSNICADKIRIDGEDAKHILKALRMREGEKLTVCDGCGTDYETEIAELDKSFLTVRIISQAASASENATDITLYQCLPKGAKMEYVIQKCTELGICKIIPCISSRCVVKLNSEVDAKKKIARWQTIAKAAAEQSGRSRIPQVCMPLDFQIAIENMSRCALAFLPYENERENSLKTLLRKHAQPKTAAFMIGPEGGFSVEEVEMAKQSGLHTITLGNRILRTETAAEVVVSMLNYEYEL